MKRTVITGENSTWLTGHDEILNEKTGEWELAPFSKWVFALKLGNMAITSEHMKAWAVPNRQGKYELEIEHVPPVTITYDEGEPLSSVRPVSLTLEPGISVSRHVHDCRREERPFV